MAAFQNDPTYAAGDKVLVYENAGIAALAEHPTARADGGNPRVGTILREHPSEPGTFEVAYDDDRGGYALISDTQRLRHISDAAK